MFKRFEFGVTVRFADQNIALKCEAQPENHFILKLLSRKKERKKKNLEMFPEAANVMGWVERMQDYPSSILFCHLHPAVYE